VPSNTDWDAKVRVTVEFVIGRVIAGRYEIVRQLGAGGMGAVYQARQLSMDRMVALKLIHPHIASEEVAKRFHREMKVTSKIEHPNTIRVFDFGADEGGQLFLAMEFLEGRPLSKVLEADGVLPQARIVHIATQVVRALGAAHAEGIAHRDLKPDNIMLVDRYGERDVVKVLDFGIARFVDGDQSRTQMTHDGAVVGTPAYMSPEQAMGQPIDPRADFYSLGVMLYQMAIGRLPFDGPTLAALLVAHATQEPPRPSVVAPGVVAPAMEALILRLLSKSPADRPATAAEVLAALEALPVDAAAQVAAAQAAPVPSLPASPSPSEARPAIAITAETPRPPERERRPLWPIVIVGLAVLAGAGVVAVRVAMRPRVDAKARALLDAAMTADGDPLAPADCRASDSALDDRLTKAASKLQASSIGNPRQQDREALTLLTSIKDGDDSAEYWALLSRARLVVEPTPEGALAAAKKAVERCPTMALAYNALGGAESRAHDDAAATAAYKEALKLAPPTYVAPRFNLGLLALRARDMQGAIAAFDDVLQKQPTHSRAPLARGQARLVTGDLNGALDDLEQATLHNPTDGDAWFLLGQARAASGARKTAVEAFCKARALGNADAVKLCPTG
jgi:tRNA A-37 threonylcarbamoyl transferase component Bud32/Flp pilus assembly protein TadD